MHISKSHSNAISWSGSEWKEEIFFVKLWVLYEASWAEFKRVGSPVLFTLVDQVDRNFHVASFRERDAVDDDVLIAVTKVHSRRRIETEDLVDNAAEKRQFLRI